MIIAGIWFNVVELLCCDLVYVVGGAQLIRFMFTGDLEKKNGCIKCWDYGES